ncbi:MAG: four helix bundle protein [Candidatus Tantalella remota]|nr:four helix bundle protein [Candidatus Tantalella remota]
MAYSDLEERTFDFAVKTIHFLRILPYSREIDIIKQQLAKSATSVGANYEESQGAFSKEDFRYKIGICFREAKESNYWFRIIDAIGVMQGDQLDYLIQESCELKKIFGSIYKKTHRRTHKQKGPAL